MIRRLFIAASGILVMMCIGAVVLWVRSHSFYDSWSYGRPMGGFCELSSMRGRICMEGGTTPTPLEGWAHSASPIERGMGSPWGETNSLGFHFEVNRQRVIYNIAEVDGQAMAVVHIGVPPPVSHSSLLVVPYWFVCLLVAASAGITFRFRRRSARLGHCPTCGYDLRASTGRCPECGSPIPARS